MRTFRIYYFSHIKLYNTVLSIHIILYVTSQDLFGNKSLLITFTTCVLNNFFSPLFGKTVLNVKAHHSVSKVLNR